MIKVLEVAMGDPTRAPGWYWDDYARRYIYWDGTRWYYYTTAGAYAPLGTRWETAPKVVNVAVGDTLRISSSFYYNGPAFSGNIYGAIGSHLVGFDEKIHATVALTIADTGGSSQLVFKDVDIPITSVLHAGNYYSIYTKIDKSGITPDVDVTMSPYLEDAIFIVGVEALFSDFAITDYVKV